MPLTLFVGSPGSRRSGALYEAVKAATSRGRGALLALPNAREVVIARRAFADACPVGLRVGTFDGFVEGEWALSGDGRRIARGLQCDVLGTRALERAHIRVTGRGAVDVLRTLVGRAAHGADSGSGIPSGVSGRLVEAVRFYHQMLGSYGLIDRTEATRLLAKTPAPTDVVALDGFVALQPEQIALLLGWCELGADVLLALPWQRDIAGAQPLQPLVTYLEECGGRVVDLGGPSDGRGPELLSIEHAVFSGGEPVGGHGAVRLLCADGDEGEARAIAARVAELVGDHSTPARVAVAFGAPEAHMGWLRRALDDVGIGADLRVRVPVLETPFGAALASLWRFSTAAADRKDLGAFLRTPFSRVEPAEADQADLLWRSRGVLRGDVLLREAPGVRRLVRLCREAASTAITGETARKWKVLADTLLANAYPGHGTMPGGEGALDAAVHRSLCRTLEEAVLLGEGEVRPQEVWATFTRARVAWPEAPGAEQVVVLSIADLWRAEADHIIIGGLTAAEFPSRTRTDRLEGDAVRAALRALDVDAEPESDAADRLAFYLGVASARSSLTLVRRAVDDEGRPMRESVFWDEFLDLYPEGDVVEPAVPIASGGAGSGSGAVAVDRHELTDPRALEDLAEIGAVSPGEIERYAACPYAWFVQHRLHPESPDAAIDVLAVGSQAHEVLARFYDRWRESGHERITQASLAEARALAEGIIVDLMARAPQAQTLEEGQLQARIGPSVVALLERDVSFLPDYAPAHIEWSFGMGDDAPVDLGGVLVKGRADRIDLGPQGIVVIDYKRSTATSLAQIEKKGLVQLQLYAAAAAQRFGLPIAGGLYRSLARPDDRGFVLEEVAGRFVRTDRRDRRGIDEVMAQAIETACRAVEGMRAGRITPTPDKDACAWCAASSFCAEAVGS